MLFFFSFHLSFSSSVSGQNLVSTYTDVPDSVEILYLSRNKISILDDEELSVSNDYIYCPS
jgi:hypothetical protein